MNATNDNHLALRSSIAAALMASAGTNTYVAWAQPAAGGPLQNLGALKVGEDRSGKLVTKTAERSAKISITPEAAPSVIKPNHDPVMWTTVNRPQ